MIGLLEGRLVELSPGRVVVSAGGVGYELAVPLSAHSALAGAESVRLHVHTHVREDQITLFGFLSRRERDVFRILLGISGIGPRLSLSLLSSLSPEELAAAVEGEQWRRLAGVPGIGQRTAAKIVVELKGKLHALAAPAPVHEDAVSALVNLGYPARQAAEAVTELVRAAPGLELGELLRRALRALSR